METNPRTGTSDNTHRDTSKLRSEARDEPPSPPTGSREPLPRTDPPRVVSPIEAQPLFHDAITRRRSLGTREARGLILRRGHDQTITAADPLPDDALDAIIKIRTAAHEFDQSQLLASRVYALGA